jgi:hypothetical protein
MVTCSGVHFISDYDEVTDKGLTAIQQQTDDFMESEKLAITLRMIIEAYGQGEISKIEAKILLNQQKVAATAVLTAAEGMAAVAVQSALNAGLRTVKDFVNSKLGFPLL